MSYVYRQFEQMDPITQGALGAATSRTVFSLDKNRFATLILGALGGMAADLDVLIRSTTDPLLALEFHRHFTHSLIFIPLGGLVCSIVLYFFFKKKLSFKEAYLFTTIGYATHALLDACTTYGTQLFWPFSNSRIAWNSISVIDPLASIPLGILTILSFRMKRAIFAKIGLSYFLLYIALGAVQHGRAISFARQTLNQAKIKIQNIDAKPSFGNIFLWKIVSATKDTFYVDAVRIGIFNKSFISGESIQKLNLKESFPNLRKDSRQYKDIKRFTWFSNGYVAIAPKDPNYIIDVRYSLVPNEIAPLWGIRVDTEKPNEHVKYIRTSRATTERVTKFWKLLTQN